MTSNSFTVAGLVSSSNKNLNTKLFSSNSSETTSAATVMATGPSLPAIPENSKRLFLVRHGEVINPGGDRPVYYGAQDVSLSPLGEEEAKASAIYLKQFNLQHIGSSPLSRAIFGANQVLQQQPSLSDTEPRDLKVYNGFIELDRGSWCGKTKDEIGSDLMAKFDACDESITPLNGESYRTLKKRVLEARDEILDITDCGKASAVVSHLQVTRSMLSDALGLGVEEISSLKIGTASVTCIDYSVDGDSGELQQVVHFQSFKPDFGLEESSDGAN